MSTLYSRQQARGTSGGVSSRNCQESETSTLHENVNAEEKDWKDMACFDSDPEIIDRITQDFSGLNELWDKQQSDSTLSEPMEKASQHTYDEEKAQAQPLHPPQAVGFWNSALTKTRNDVFWNYSKMRKQHPLPGSAFANIL